MQPLFGSQSISLNVDTGRNFLDNRQAGVLRRILVQQRAALERVRYHGATRALLIAASLLARQLVAR